MTTTNGLLYRCLYALRTPAPGNSQPRHQAAKGVVCRHVLTANRAAMTVFTAVILVATMAGMGSLAYAGGCDTTTTTTLTLSSNSVLAGNPVLLTATVVAVPPPVTRGLVTFCDATAAICDGAAVLGTAQLTSAGTATLNLTLGVGTYSIDAIYQGYRYYAVLPSTSAAQAFTVNGNPNNLYASATTIAATGSVGNYTLVGTVNAFGKPPMAATVSFIDTTNNNVVAASAALDPTTLGRNFLPSPGSPITEQYAQFVATGDFNNDGIPDLVVINNSFAGVISVSLGVGDGTFLPAVQYNVGGYPESVAVGDFNHDGNADLAVTNLNDNTVSIFLGTGTGTFGAQTTFATGGQPYGIAVADVNTDGYPDLVVVNNGDNTVGVLFGNGDGTFQTQVPYAVGSDPVGVTVADFNNDGRPDLAVGNRTDQTVSVLLGTGGGVFGAQTVFDLTKGISPFYLTSGDLRQNGSIDLVVPGGYNPEVAVLLGNNDGTFQAPVVYTVGDAPQGLALGDVNNDGILDLVVADTGDDGLVSVLIGNGDGTFAAKTDYSVGNGPINLALADYNGDGLLDIATADEAQTSSIILQQISETATSTGVAVYGPGTDYVLASYPGDAGRAASASNTVPLLDLPQTATTTSLSASVNPATAGQSVSFMATVSPAPTGSTTGTVSFYSGTTLLGTVTVNSSGVATYTTGALPAGPDAITAVYSGNAAFIGSTSTGLVENITAAATATTFSVSPNPATAGQPVTLTATVSPAPTGSSAGTVSFYNGSTLLGTATVNSSGVATFTTSSLPAGTDNLTAVYSGNAGFATSTSSVLSLTVTTAGVIYTVTAPPTPFALTQGGSVNIPITVPPIGGAYNAVVTMSVTGLPPGATATFNPPTVIPGSTGAQTVMTVTLAAKAVNVPGPARKYPSIPLRPFSVAFALCGAAFMLTRMPRKLRLAGALAGFAGVAMLISGCSGGFAGGPSTALGSYVLTVTGTSGSHHPSTTVTIVVK
jgi:Bacterial Ig-like domain (group 3)/FG-GAP-like repeat